MYDINICFFNMQKNICVFSKFLRIFFFILYLFSLRLIFSVAFDQKKYATSGFTELQNNLKQK